MQKFIQAGAPANVLYVVLHGLVCLVDAGSNGFIGYLLDMGSDHRYMCGDFLAEQDLVNPNGQFPVRLQLSNGVAMGTYTFDKVKDKNAIASISALPNDTQGVRAVIKLGRPSNIHHFILGDVDPKTLLDPGLVLIGKVKPPLISGIRIFEYSFTDYTSVKLLGATGNAFWSCPAPVPVANKLVAVLHVYNEPPRMMTNAAAHNKDEFNLSAQFLGVNVQLTVAAFVNPSHQPLPSARPDGILGWEIAGLDVRNVLGTINHVSALRISGSAGDPLGGGGGSQVCGGANGILV